MGSVKLYRSLRLLEAQEPITLSHKKGVLDSGEIYLLSNTSQTVTWDYGDGSATVQTTGTSHVMPNYTYPAGYGQGVEKVITVTLTDPSAVTEGTFRFFSPLTGAAPTGLEQLNGLNKLTMEHNDNTMETFPAGIEDIKTLTSVVFLSNFKNDTIYEAKIPDSLMGMPLETLYYTEGLVSADALTNNMSNIYKMAATLKTLVLGNFPSPASFNFLPDDAVYGFQHLINLENYSTTFYGRFSEPPPVLMQLSSLKTLTLRGVALTSWGNIGVSGSPISHINFRDNTGLPTALPLNFNNRTALKEFYLNGSYNTTTRVDAFINSFYDLVVNNAFISGVSTDPFRSMIVNVTGGVPTGVYQQPAGYVQGSDNGTPASQKEKLWVLANQYSHTITYTAS